ncbi:hypothetical protein BDR05DRAFT_966436 [Suillus weaverae]|nr:hypothetical protein BDR05DRAFT_966436 [Suillus weaverae]
MVSLLPGRKIRIAYGWTGDFIIKCVRSAAGYGLLAVPLLITRKRSRGAVLWMERENGDESR